VIPLSQCTCSNKEGSLTNDDPSGGLTRSTHQEFVTHRSTRKTAQLSSLSREFMSTSGIGTTVQGEVHIDLCLDNLDRTQIPGCANTTPSVSVLSAAATRRVHPLRCGTRSKNETKPHTARGPNMARQRPCRQISLYTQDGSGKKVGEAQLLLHVLAVAASARHHHTGEYDDNVLANPPGG
jgi:hypothetical protein